MINIIGRELKAIVDDEYALCDEARQWLVDNVDPLLKKCTSLEDVNALRAELSRMTVGEHGFRDIPAEISIPMIFAAGDFMDWSPKWSGDLSKSPQGLWVDAEDESGQLFIAVRVSGGPYEGWIDVNFKPIPPPQRWRQREKEELS